MKDVILTTNQAAAELGRMEGKPISERRIRQFCEQGRLGTPFGDRWVISLAELKTFSKIPRPAGRQPRSEK